MQKNIIPIEACVYEEYDPLTLRPSNSATATRLLELDWNAKEFENKSVLDIGCNTGALSIHALNLGASKVFAVDVQDPLINFFTDVVKKHNLNISISKKSFDSLDIKQDSADIVLMMEVMHWLVDQGGCIKKIIQKLADLTGEILYIETPWDISEPSIAKKNIINHEDYNSALIISELNKHFEEIKFIRFMTYFGRMKNSKRILIKASKKRNSLHVLTLLEDAYPLAAKLQEGINSVSLVTSPDGPLVVKRLPEYSVLKRLSETTLEKLISIFEIDGVIPPPILLGTSYKYMTNDGECFMVFPYRGDLSKLILNSKSDLDEPFVSPITAALESRKIFSKASSSLIKDISNFFQINNQINFDEINDFLPKGLIKKWNKIEPFLKKIYYEFSSSNYDYHEVLIHGDIQSGNIVRNSEGDFSLIDIDNIRTATIYSDVLIAGIFMGADSVAINAALKKQSHNEIRSPNHFDILFSVYHTLGWINIICMVDERISKKLIDQALEGFKSIKKIYETLN